MYCPVRQETVATSVCVCVCAIGGFVECPCCNCKYYRHPRACLGRVHWVLRSQGVRMFKPTLMLLVLY